MGGADRGLSSGENRRDLQRGGGHYIIAEKLRSDSAEVKAALSQRSRYQAIGGNLQIKQVTVFDADGRFVICHNPEAAERDRHVRDNLLARPTEVITGSDVLPATKRAELHGQISTKPGLNRYLRLRECCVSESDGT